MASQQGDNRDGVALPHLCVRGNEGFFLYPTSGPAAFSPRQIDAKATQRSVNQVFSWSSCGNFFAWCDAENLMVFDASNLQVVFKHPKSRVISIEFSPKNTYISTFEPFSNANKSQNNICIFSLLGQDVVATFTQGSFENWRPQFSDDEKVCCKLLKETAVFYVDGDFGTPKYKLKIPGLAVVEMLPKEPYHVAIYVAGSKKGTPSVVKILRFPDLDQYSALSSKSFFKADKATLHWNKPGTGLIIKSMTEVDQSGQAYYGETMLFYISTEGSSSVVELNKKGPIYNICWDPNSSEFCVTYGHMPSKASLFNSKCSSVYDFGTGLRTACSFSPQGHLLALYGHGGVRSNVEIWYRPTFSLIAKIADFQDITCFDWSPCGERLLLGTHSPTLKVSNKWAVYTYDGKLIKADMGKEGMSAGSRGGSNFEFWQIAWQKKPVTDFPARKLQFTPLTLQDLKVQEATEKKYVPPHLRKKEQQSEKQSIVLDLNDLPDNERAAALNGNKSPGGTRIPEVTQSGHSITYKSGVDPSGPASQYSGGVVGLAPGAIEKSKKNRIKTLEKRLKEINQLKDKQKSGQKLEKEALNKINREQEVRAELNQLKG